MSIILQTIFQMPILELVLCFSIQISVKFVSKGLIGQDNGLAPNRQQVIILWSILPTRVYMYIFVTCQGGESF